MKKLYFLIIFLLFLFFFVQNTYASHTYTARMAARFMHNNGSTQWEVAYRYWYDNEFSARAHTGIWFAWTDSGYPNFLGYDWTSDLMVGPDFRPNSEKHPPYRIQWGTTCIDPKEPPIYQTQDGNPRVFVFYSDVTYNKSRANNTGRRVDYAYGNTISNSTWACPFDCEPRSCGNACGEVWDGCSKTLQCGGCGNDFCEGANQAWECVRVNRFCNGSNNCDVSRSRLQSSCGSRDSCTNPPGNRSENASCRGEAGTDRASVITFNWNSTPYTSSYDVRYRINGNAWQTTTGINGTQFSTSGSGCTTGPSGCSLPYGANVQWEVKSNLSTGDWAETAWSSTRGIQTNNCDGLPDLDISQFSFSNTRNETQTTNPTVVIRNRQDGYKNVTGSYTVRVCNGNNTCWDKPFSRNLAEGDTFNVSDSFAGMPLPPANRSGNPWTARVVVDYGDAVNEYRENNNDATDNFNTTARISGRIWVDENRNGRIDSGDVPYTNSLPYWDGQKHVTIDGTNYNVNVNNGTYQTGELPGGDYNPNLPTDQIPRFYEKIIDPSSFVLSTNANGSNQDFLIRIILSDISVRVYEDYNGNGGPDPLDNLYRGATITVTGIKAGTYTDGGGNDGDGARNGTIVVAKALPGSSTIRLTVPSGYRYVANQPAQPRTVSVPPDRTVNFFIQPPPPECGNLVANPNRIRTYETSTLSINCTVGGQSGTLNYTYTDDPNIAGDSVTNNNTARSTYRPPDPWLRQVVATVGVEVCQAGSGGDLCVVRSTTLTIIPVFSISGNVFLDDNKSKRKEGGESNYTAGITIRAVDSGGTSYPVTYPAPAGSYLASRLESGNYVISYLNKPDDFIFTYPRGSSSFYVSLGNTTTPFNCSVGSNPQEERCLQGSIINLNFGITDSIPWMQSGGSDVWFNNGINNPIPSDASVACGGPYMSTNGAAGRPGVVYSGGGSSYFRDGQASPNPYNWKVGGTSSLDAENYTPAIPGVMKTSYTYINSLLNQNGITPINLNTLTGCSNPASSCSLPNNLQNGVYIASGNVDLTRANFAGGRDYVILVPGNLIIRSPIDVPVGSTVLFTVRGDIIVDVSVGQANERSTAPSIQGWFSSDHNFTINGSNNCPNSDRRLNVEGAIVVNASLTGGSFNNNRDLCLGNKTCPVFYIKERPDFILNAPLFLMNSRRVWQEIAP